MIPVNHHRRLKATFARMVARHLRTSRKPIDERLILEFTRAAGFPASAVKAIESMISPEVLPRRIVSQFHE